MDDNTPLLPAPKRRRRHSPEFKAMVLSACAEPGNSIAAVAQRYGVNANLVHKWRRQRERSQADFVRLPSAPPVVTSSGSTVRITLPGGIVVDWPVDRIDASAAWLKVLMR